MAVLEALRQPHCLAVKAAPGAVRVARAAGGSSGAMPDASGAMDASGAISEAMKNPAKPPVKLYVLANI